ncbi:hypothetical protein DFJ73DRAFT_851825 [Zopfochytrium polystomum]|nr:hypothetical protein DFJ73DRAFT_851825 [Zopfochytrium polystomum]
MTPWTRIRMVRADAVVLLPLDRVSASNAERVPTKEYAARMERESERCIFSRVCSTMRIFEDLSLSLVGTPKNLALHKRSDDPLARAQALLALQPQCWR